MLTTWIYISKAETSVRSASDAMIYLEARPRNRALHITGYLHREAGYFAQYIEGPEDAVMRLRWAIRKDWRHTDIRELYNGDTESRRFPGWDMAFSNEEIGSFQAYQKTRGRDQNIASADVGDIMAFFDGMAAQWHKAGPENDRNRLACR